jgi:DNA gyrase subunit A
LGKVYWIKVFRLPRGSREARGRPIVNLLPLEDGEKISAILPVKDYPEDQFIFMATRRGTVKKVPLEQFSRPRSVGLIALDLRADDQLVNVGITDGQCDILMFSRQGKVVRFNETNVRAMGRTALGVRGIRLLGDDYLIALIINNNADILTVSENGYGKRTPIEDYPLRGRGTQGVLALKKSEKTGEIVGAVQVSPDDEIMMIANSGQLVRTKVGGVSVLSRNTQGVKLISLRDSRLVGVDRIAADLISIDEELSDDEPVNGEVIGVQDDAAGSDTQPE